MAAQFRGVFLTSGHPRRTAEFYRDVAGLELEHVGQEGAFEYWKVDRDGMQLAIHDAAKFSDYTYPANPDSNLTHLYFKIPDQQEFLDHLAKMGIEPYRLDEVVVTVLDPDGRKVMFGTA